MATLLDTLTRHQFYLEGVKAGQTLRFERVILELREAIRAELMTFDFDFLDDASRTKINDLVRRIRALQKSIYNKYSEDVIEQLLLFLDVESDMSFSIFEEDENGIPIFPWFVKRPTKEELQKLWAFIALAPIPANGLLTVPFIQGFTVSASRNIENLITQAWANKDSKRKLIDTLLGTKGLNYKDGALARIVNQNGAVVDTIFQHVSAITQGATASIFFRRYQWVSIIDNATTDICRSRNNRVYEYGTGPLPPAHIRCRSKVVPFSATNPLPENMPSLYDWVKAQPAKVQDDLVGAAQGEQLRSGKSKAKDYARFMGATPLSIRQFAGKLSMMKTD